MFALAFSPKLRSPAPGASGLSCPQIDEARLLLWLQGLALAGAAAVVLHGLAVAF